MERFSITKINEYIFSEKVIKIIDHKLMFKVESKTVANTASIFTSAMRAAKKKTQKPLTVIKKNKRTKE